ncbi:MAG: RNase P subunit p30 family protein [Euryarchaeota archaeon]|nr:RNase P subunit p30 family protein [Euryarchaeota archaeon]
MTIRTGKSYDFSIHTAPECSDTPEAMAEIASGYGYAGLAITNHTPHQLQKPQKQGMTDYAGIAVYQGIEIVAKNPHHLRQMIQKHRAKVRVLSVHGGNEKINHTDIFSNRIFKRPCRSKQQHQSVQRLARFCDMVSSCQGNASFVLFTNRR